MKKRLFYLFFLLLFLNCDENNINNFNPFLPNFQFSITIDTNLPSFISVTNPGNAIRVFDASGPTNGIIVFNTGSGFTAFDGSCPNQAITDCSFLQINAPNANCLCDDVSYSLFTGLALGTTVEYPLKAYRVERNGTILRIFN